MWPITAKYCDHVTNHSWVLWSCEQWEMSIVTMRPNREKYCDHVTNERWVLPMLAAHIAIIWTWSLSELLAVRTSSYTHTRWGLVTTLTLLLLCQHSEIYGCWTRTIFSAQSSEMFLVLVFPPLDIWNRFCCRKSAFLWVLSLVEPNPKRMHFLGRKYSD